MTNPDYLLIDEIRNMEEEIQKFPQKLFISPNYKHLGK
jgi:hypothetical protein